MTPQERLDAIVEHAAAVKVEHYDLHTAVAEHVEIFRQDDSLSLRLRESFVRLRELARELAP